VKTTNKISHEDETWTMNNNAMPIVDQTAHIGIQRHFKDSIDSWRSAIFHSVEVLPERQIHPNNVMALL
jgi:hypothetical protein